MRVIILNFFALYIFLPRFVFLVLPACESSRELFPSAMSEVAVVPRKHKQAKARGAARKRQINLQRAARRAESARLQQQKTEYEAYIRKAHERKQENIWVQYGNDAYLYKALMHLHFGGTIEGGANLLKQMNASLACKIDDYATRMLLYSPARPLWTALVLALNDAMTMLLLAGADMHLEGFKGGRSMFEVVVESIGDHGDGYLQSASQYMGFFLQCVDSPACAETFQSGLTSSTVEFLACCRNRLREKDQFFGMLLDLETRFKQRLGLAREVILSQLSHIPPLAEIAIGYL